MRNWLEIERIITDYLYYGYTFPQFRDMGYKICDGLTEDEMKIFWREVRNWVGDGCINTSPARQKLYREGRL